MNNKYSFKVTVMSIRLEREHLLEGLTVQETALANTLYQ